MKPWSKLRSLFRKTKLDAEMAEEMRLHLELQTERNIAAGMDATEARYAAQRMFGGVEQIKERCRDQRSWVWLEQTLRDVRFAGRVLGKNRGFTAAAVISLALCIGGNTAIFSMLYALVIRPLPFREPAQIVEIYNSFPKVGIAKLASNLGQYSDFKQNAAGFEHVALWRLDDYTLGEDSGPSRVSGAIATAEIFDVLGVQPLIGRFFAAENHVPAADKVVVLMESFWESHFQRSPDIVGQTVRLDGAAFEIVGVAPRNLEAFDARARFVRPLSWPADQPVSRMGYSPQLYARLKPTATVGEASAQIVALEQRFYENAPPSIREFYDRTGHVIQVDTVQAERAGPVKTALYLLQGGAVAVLLIGCVNVANLLLARTLARRGEFAMRVAFGASRGALVRQLFVESALLAGLGTVLGLGLARIALGAANHFTSQARPDALPFAIDGHALGYAAVIAIAVTLFIGLLPVAHLLGGNLHDLMQRHRCGVSAGFARTTSSLLIIVQTAFSLVLLTGAGLLIRSFEKVLAVDPGFDPRHVIVARIGLPADKEKSFPPLLEASLREMADATVSLATATPFLLVSSVQVSMPLGSFTLRNTTLPAGAPEPGVFFCGASLSYLETLRIPLRQGRWFSRFDVEKGRAVVVDETFANRYFGGRSAVGQRLVLTGTPPKSEDDWLEIVGVVGNVRHNGVEEKSGHPFLYRPLPQASCYGAMSVFIRTERPVSEVVALLRKKIAEIDPTLPLIEAGPLQNVISNSFNSRRGIMLLLASFAGVALMLSAVGLYGVLAYDVSQRTREIGIRSAIGATRTQIAQLVLWQGLWKTGVGVVAGLAAATALGRFMTSLLFEVRPIEPLVCASVALLLIAVAAVASWLPARRAARVDPTVALRCE